MLGLLTQRLTLQLLYLLTQFSEYYDICKYKLVNEDVVHFSLKIMTSISMSRQLLVHCTDKQVLKSTHMQRN